MGNKPGLYFEKLDELRFFAFFLVFWQHGFTNSVMLLLDDLIPVPVLDKLMYTGGVGVHVFFVISGFLITFLMINEQKMSGTFNLKFFYLRRALRIWPVYYLVIISGIFIFPNLFSTFEFHGNVFKQLFFLNNFDPQPGSFVGIAWSVAIEEQFYLVWPLVFIALSNRNVLLAFCVAAFFGSVAFILYNPETFYFHTLGNVKYLMIGCVSAILYTRHSWLSASDFMSSNLALTGVVVAAVLLHLNTGINAFMYGLSNIFLPILFAYIVVNVVNRKGSGKPSAISTLGKYTYGMYFYHPAIILSLKVAFDLANLDYKHSAPWSIALTVTALIATIVISILSYRFYEKPILTFKNRFSIVKTRI